MNIIYFGTSDFAAETLKALLGSRHTVRAVVTQPDRRRGRDLKIGPPPVKVLAESEGIPLFQPDDLSSASFETRLKDFSADLFVVVSFGCIFRKPLLATPRLFSINLHTSLLPKYRGAAPIHWAIVNGETKTGVTVIRMNERLDAGDILGQREVAIDAKDTSITLGVKLAAEGGKLLIETVDALEAGTATPRPQDEKDHSIAPKLKKSDGLIDWRKSARSIVNQVRGLRPWPGAYTSSGGKTLKIIEADAVPSSFASAPLAPGEIAEVEKEAGIVVKTGDGNLCIKRLQLEGRKELDAKAFVRGFRLLRGDLLGS